MFPPGDGGGAPTQNMAAQKERLRRPRGEMTGGAGFTPPGLDRGAMDRMRGASQGQGLTQRANPMMPRPMGGMGAPPGLGGQVPGMAQRLAMMRGQGPAQGPPMQMPAGRPMPFQGPAMQQGMQAQQQAELMRRQQMMQPGPIPGAEANPYGRDFY